MKFYPRAQTLLDLNQGKVDIGDPGTSLDSPFMIKGLDVRPGYWSTFYYPWEGQARIAELVIVHQSRAYKFLPMHYHHWTEIGNVSVDSGLCGFFPSPKPMYTEEQWTNICMMSEQLMFLYGSVYSTSGLGDGYYPVSVYKDTHGDIVAIKIDYHK